jgi:hypothetical protein
MMKARIRILIVCQRLRFVKLIEVWWDIILDNQTDFTDWNKLFISFAFMGGRLNLCRFGKSRDSVAIHFVQVCYAVKLPDIQSQVMSTKEET